MILKSRKLRQNPTLVRLLDYLIKETLAGRSARLKQYNIATAVLGRAADFSPETDPIVRITVGRLRKVMAEHYALEGLAEAARFEIPVGSYVPMLLLAEPASAAEYPERPPGSSLAERVPEDAASAALRHHAPGHDVVTLAVLAVVCMNFVLLAMMLFKH
jgi:hypothetical protein